jgi:uncharacterized alpha-E superfamily protein
MIANAAQNAYWMFRYLERSEAMARALLCEHQQAMGSCKKTHGQDLLWKLYPEREVFTAINAGKVSDEESCRFFFSWQDSYPDSLYNSIKHARSDAKLIRDIIGEKLWTNMNSLYLWLSDGPAKEIYSQERDRFYLQIIETLELTKGHLYNSCMEDSYFYVIDLGIRIERAFKALDIVRCLIEINKDQRKVDSSDALEEGGAIHAMRYLLTCSDASYCFLSRGYEFNIQSCVNFFLNEPLHPHSFLNAIKRIDADIKNIDSEVSAVDIHAAQAGFLKAASSKSLKGYTRLLKQLDEALMETSNLIQKKLLE